MKKMFLTSSTNEVSFDFPHHFDKPISGIRLVFIDTAAEVETGDKKWLADDRQSLVNVGFAVSDYTLTGKNAQQLQTDLADFDVIYLSGGNTFYLLQQAQKSGFIEVIRDLVLNQNKIYIGTSAGSIVPGPDIYATLRLDSLELAPEIKGFAGFNLVNFIIFPHWGSQYFKDLYLNRRLDFSYKDTQWPIVILTDHQYVLVEDDNYQIIDTTQRPQK